MDNWGIEFPMLMIMFMTWFGSGALFIGYDLMMHAVLALCLSSISALWRGIVGTCSWQDTDRRTTMLRDAFRVSWTLGDRGSIYCEIERVGFAQLRPVFSC